MGRRFEYSDYAQELRKDRELVTRAVETIRRTVKLHGPRAVQAEIEDAPRPPVDRGTYRRDWRFDDIPNGATMYNFSPYASIIEDGRRPGARMPPLSVIEDWVRRKGIGRQYGPDQQGRRKVSRKLNDSEIRGIAFVIARAIKARGIQGLHIAELAAEVVDEQVRRDIDTMLKGGPT